MIRQPHDLPCIPKPSPSQKELLALYNRRQRLEQEFPGVDIGAIHYKRGAVAAHLRGGKK